MAFSKNQPKFQDGGPTSISLSPSLSGSGYRLTICTHGDLELPCEPIAGGEIDLTGTPVPLKLVGTESIVGLGVALNKGTELIGRGVIGISKEGSYSNRGATMARCRLQPVPKASGMNVTGLVEILPHAPGLTVIARVENLVGQMSYGIHIHAKGDLSSIDGLSTGGHYNPMEKPHRLPGGGEDVGHVGDLGNIAFYDNAGVGWYYEDWSANPQKIFLADVTSNILGRAIVVHSQMDNGCEQPTGGAGSRLAFCVVGSAPSDTLTYQKTNIPFTVPPQRGSKGCSLNNSPEKAPKSTSFVWMTVIISLALAGVGILFAYNWWRARNNPAGNNAAGRSVWLPYPEDDEEEGLGSS